MIVRIVKMHFRNEEIDSFKKIFEESKEKIRNFPGVRHLEMLQAQKDKSIFFTYSHWESEEALEAYRESKLFRSTWAKTKILFRAPAEAWSTEMLHQLK